MWERTVTIGSAGKTFSVTGWKVGWLIGAAPLIHAAKLAHARIAFCVATPLQDAVASGFEQAAKNNFFEEQRKMLEAKKGTLLKVFDDLGLPYSEPAGSYFTLVNTEGVRLPVERVAGEPRDWTTCKWLTTAIGVAAIPPTAFYATDNKAICENYARFCFCKTDETLEKAAARLSTELRKFL